MTSVFNRRVPAAVTSVILSAALLLSGCGSASHGEGKDSESATDTETETGREPLNTIHINIGTSKDPEETDAETGTDGENSVRLPLTLDMGAEYTDRFTFLCDSAVYGLKSLGMLSEGRGTDNVITGSGGSFYVMAEEAFVYSSEYGGLLTVGDFASRRRPEYMMLALGSSDISGKTAPSYDEFESAYTSLIGKIKESSPDTVIICLSILPGSPSSGVSVYDAEKYNARILAAAEASEVYYLDAASAFAASDGYLRPDCDGGASRLSTTGLMRLLELIRTHYVGAEK